MNEQIEYALLKRSDAGYWQGIAGGGENEEKPVEAAKSHPFPAQLPFFQKPNERHRIMRV